MLQGNDLQGPRAPRPPRAAAGGEVDGTRLRRRRRTRAARASNLFRRLWRRRGVGKVEVWTHAGVPRKVEVTDEIQIGSLALRCRVESEGLRMHFRASYQKGEMCLNSSVLLLGCLCRARSFAIFG